MNKFTDELESLCYLLVYYQHSKYPSYFYVRINQ